MNAYAGLDSDLRPTAFHPVSNCLWTTKSLLVTLNIHSFDRVFYSFPSSGCHCTAPLNDLHVFDPIALNWTDLADINAGIPPMARGSHDFTSAGGQLYVYGGYSYYIGKCVYVNLGTMSVFLPSLRASIRARAKHPRTRKASARARVSARACVRASVRSYFA